eukprot:GFYU01007703.1.p1 GENE.GFYU01007703.1~~GFYU01007703.1.p1  ORF type:complete len:247 (-),score=33.35 GFYU01007703.1:208-948(-)
MATRPVSKRKPSPKKKRAQKQQQSVGRPDFNLSTTAWKLHEYSSLTDGHLRHFFETPEHKKHLYKSGLIDKQGRVIDAEKNKSKLYIIEQEFKSAERAELQRKKDEEEMRRRIQLKRHEAIEQARNAERMAKLKEDRRRRQEYIRTTLHDKIKYASPKPAPKSASGVSRGRRNQDKQSEASYHHRAQSSLGTGAATAGGHTRNKDQYDDDFSGSEDIEEELDRVVRELSEADMGLGAELEEEDDGK